MTFSKDLEALQKMVASRDADAASPVPAGERPCPICKQTMQVENFEGITIDVCPSHGIWLDNGELPRLLDRARAAASTTTFTAIRQARLEGRRDALMLLLLM